VWPRDILNTSDAHACMQTRTSATTVVVFGINDDLIATPTVSTRCE
jgi:hypothetical protein